MGFPGKCSLPGNTPLIERRIGNLGGGLAFIPLAGPSQPSGLGVSECVCVRVRVCVCTPRLRLTVFLVSLLVHEDVCLHVPDELVGQQLGLLRRPQNVLAHVAHLRGRQEEPVGTGEAQVRQMTRGVRRQECPLVWLSLTLSKRSAWTI